MTMKMKFVICFCLIIIASACHKNDKKPLISYVNLLIGTDLAATPSAKQNPGDHVDYGQTIPAVTAPFGMTQWTPQNQSTENKCVAPFYLNRTILQGFRATHWTSGSCVQDYGSFTIMPASGNFFMLPKLRQTEFVFDPSLLSPAYCAYHIPLFGVFAEITATRRCGFFRFSWLDPQNPTLIFDVNSDEGKGFIRIDREKNEIVAYNPVFRIYSGNGKPAGFSGYMVARLDAEIESCGTYSEQDILKDTLQLSDKPHIGAWVKIKPGKNNLTHVKIGTSFTSLENARENLDKEIPGWDFDHTKKSLEQTWEKLLGQVKTEGGTPDDLVKFYTALYHSCIHPRLYSDVDGSYPGFAGDTAVHKAEGFDYYCDFSAWDTYRAQMPLLSLIAPKAYLDMNKSLLCKAEQGGWLPIFPMWNSYTSAMIGDHCTAILGDAIMKGFPVDPDRAWTAMRKNAFESPADVEEYVDGKGRRSLKSYRQYGYIPLEDEVLEAFHKREQVSRTLEYAYDDWVLAQVAQKLGYDKEFRELSDRAMNYSNVFDPGKGWVCGKFADETFTQDFDAGKPVSWITEGTPKHYTWYVPQDIPGLMELMGGKEKYLGKLRQFIDNKEYWHGNEPSHHIPWLFNYADRWDLTQQTVKHLLKSEYTTTAGGLSGNDDSGQLSAWYVFSAMGFYPVCPGSNEYQLSSPAFRKVTLKLDKKFYSGGSFVLETSGNNSDSIFSSVNLNGKKTGTILNHNDLKKGGKLVFTR
ncbi:MAG TPA: GH92 family glycosyl hydrolase [Prolixibacteraceae bacterium]|nr:GH92 family glycosyl hydrolase [Prolixibacteraceae bacterium]